MLEGDSNLVIAYRPWPVFDPALLVEDSIEMPVQVNGKLRDRIKVPREADRAAIEELALASEKIASFKEGKSVKKVIVVPGKLVNLVIQ
jgi:leucyl-tRNA synthetase